MRMRLLVSVSLPLLALAAIPQQAQPQTISARSVSACGTPPVTYTAGQNFPVLQDTTGKLCTGATFSGNVTATNPSVGPTGSAVPGNATAIGFQNSGGNLTIPSASNPLPVSFAASGNTTVVGPTAVGSAAANPPVLIAGTGNGTANGLVQVAKVDSGGNVSVTVPGTVTVTQATAANLNATVIGAGTAGTPNAGVESVQGISGGTNLPVSQATAANLNATVVGAGTAGTANAGVVTVQGIASMTPILDNNTPQGGSSYSNRTNWVGNTTTIANTTATTVIPSPGAGNSIFLTDADCSNSSTTANVTVTLNDNAGTVLGLPAQAGWSHGYITPREVAGNTALTMTLSANATSVTCTLSGYKAAT
jgi:hypothetical protein